MVLWLWSKICIKYRKYCRYSFLSTIDCRGLAYFDPRKYILKLTKLTFFSLLNKINFFVQMLQCAETLILYFFGLWRNEKTNFKSRILLAKLQKFSVHTAKNSPGLPSFFYCFLYLVHTCGCGIGCGCISRGSSCGGCGIGCGRGCCCVSSCGCSGCCCIGSGCCCRSGCVISCVDVFMFVWD